MFLSFHEFLLLQETSLVTKQSQDVSNLSWKIMQVFDLPRKIK